MRVVAGRFRGRLLRTVRGQGVRPTSGRVRTTIFDVLGPTVQGARVLDLFAGTGSLGIEALSRGASKAVFVERSRRVLMALEQNLRALGLTQQDAEALCAEALSYLRRWQGPEPFDIIFADPPYDFVGYQALLALVAHNRVLAPAGLVVLEYRTGTVLPSRIGQLRLTKSKTFGTTSVSWFTLPREDHEDGDLSRDV
ncbi:MAG: 16S rRNA (guanine(966)-N(2))-methyltransferase RsmD [candidate division KSB1 bacterium]|nr:16S rRNA (guanine(966)-N(2))-methyltransferase RsmD [candidate division KSB1 bacterium]